MTSQRIRILEVGNRALFSMAYPETTLLLWTGADKVRTTPGQVNFSVWSLIRVWWALRRRRFDVLVVYPPLDAPLSLRFFLRLLGRHGPFCLPALFRSCGSFLPRLPFRTPVVVLDTEDTAVVERHNFWLLERCSVYFKRELPLDHWKAFAGTAHPHIPTARIRKQQWLSEGITKMRPLSLGISEEKVRQIGTPGSDKTTDVFWAGALSNSSVRTEGIKQLEALRQIGYRVDLAGPDLSPQDYFARCSRAWLTWSPEGYGWDCFRHYEAAVCGSVPVISRATIHRHQPLQEGVHCFYYDPEGDGLQETIRRALRDKDQLKRMAQQPRDHVLRHHTQRRLCDYVLGVALPGGPRP